MPNDRLSIHDIIANFTRELTAAIEANYTERLRETLDAIRAQVQAPGQGAPGLPHNAFTAMPVAPPTPQLTPRVAGVFYGQTLRPKRKLPKQYCPVPGCKNTAAPIFGMVCKDHRDIPKAQIRKFREQRRLEKEGAQ